MRYDTKTDIERQRILVIDDDEEFTDDLTFLLDGPYAFRAASDSRKGIDLLEKERFDLVLLDLNMPSFFAPVDEREGIEVLGIIRRKWDTGVPIIILTRMDSADTRKESEKLKADAFYAKPPEIRVLKEKIEELLGKGKQSQ